MRSFCLIRAVDTTGVSGVGMVAEGVEFSNGWCAMTWLTKHSSVAFYPSLDALIAIHGHGGSTNLVFRDE